MPGLPEIPAQDIVLGLASAVLLLLAAYYLIRPRSDRPAGETALLADSPFANLFVEIAPDDTARRLSFVGSLFLHLMLVALVPWLQLLFPGNMSFQPPRYKAITLEYHIPLPPLVAPSEVEKLAELTAESKLQEKPDGDSTNPKLALEDRPAQETEEQVAAKSEAADEAARPGSQQEAQEPSREEVKVTQAEGATPKPKPAPAPKEIVKLLVPELVRSDPALKDIVLQPDFEVDLPPDYSPNIPPVLLWTAQSPKLEDRVILKPGPGDAETPTQMRLPDVEPQVSLPNDLPTIADLQMEQILALAEEPPLSLPVADVTPLSGHTPPAEALEEAPSIRGDDGLNSLMILSSNPDILNPIFQLEPGLRFGAIDPKPSDMPEGVVGGTDPSGEAETPSSGVVEQAAADVPRIEAAQEGPAGEGQGEQGTGKGSEPGIEDSAAEEVKKIRIFRGGSGDGPGNVQVIDVAKALGGAGAGSPEGDELGTEKTGSSSGEAGQPDGSTTGKGRLRPLPRAQYGIILISNARSALPEAMGVLTGNPIYTVYLNVPAAPRKWVLQYCLPGSVSRKLDVSSGVVRVRPRKKLDPPFPLQKDPLHLGLNGKAVNGNVPERVVVYATVNAQGELNNLRMIRGADPKTDQTILANLRSGEFLPAFEAGEPVLVEALFGIPLQ